MLIEIHMIQNHAPSNLNRDELGAPKTCMFGGVTRARISSQCLKRSIRNPGNPEDIHNREPGMFAKAMEGHIGTRTKVFPWLVGQVLDDPKVKTRFIAGGTSDSDYENTKKAIVAACGTIARAEGKAAVEKKEKQQKDDRPKTPQLIFLGPTQARDFIDALLKLRHDSNTADSYQYFLDPAAVFEALLGPELDRTTLTEEQSEKALEAGWRIRNTETRLTKLRELLQSLEPEKEFADGPSTQIPAEQTLQADDEEIAKEIARGLELLAEKDEKEFGRLVSNKKAKGEPDFLKRKKPPHYEEFIKAVRRSTLTVSADIALFGRMTTSDYIVDVEGAMQVAHAISTHAIVNEVDYFTAVDDLGKAGGGAAHLDEAMFNSACFYKYFCLDWKQLLHNLGASTEPEMPKDKADESQEMQEWKKARKKWKDEIEPQERLAACTLGHFIRAAARTTPSGKQNSYASNCEPAGILVEIKETRIPTSYANAFAEPARRIGDPPDDRADCVSLIGRSIAQLGDHVYNVRKAYNIDSTLLWHALPLYCYPLQGWERDPDGSRAKVLNQKGEPTKEVRPPVQFAHECFPVLGGEDGKPEGLVEAVVKALNLGFEWSSIKDLGKPPAKGAQP